MINSSRKEERQRQAQHERWPGSNRATSGKEASPSTDVSCAHLAMEQGNLSRTRELLITGPQWRSESTHERYELFGSKGQPAGILQVCIPRLRVHETEGTHIERALQMKCLRRAHLASDRGFIRLSTSYSMPWKQSFLPSGAANLVAGGKWVVAGGNTFQVT